MYATTPHKLKDIDATVTSVETQHRDKSSEYLNDMKTAIDEKMTTKEYLRYMRNQEARNS